ncbi:MAG: spermine synthase, partial [Chloroflexi bacterium]|nr:spermine synthase [Chloroflexota bacterium]
DIRSVAIVGLAGGTAARQAAAFFPRVERITGWEIDPDVLEVGYRYFGLGDIGPLHAVVADGRVGLQQDANHYDLIIVDAYRPPYIPAHLATREFFALVRARLTPRGVVAINVGRTPQNRILVDTLHATLASVFPTVYGMDVPETYNTVLYASPRAIAQPRQNLWRHAQRLARERAHPGLVMAVYNAARYPSPPPGPGWVLTDDRAAIEVLTDRLVVDYILHSP